MPKQASYSQESLIDGQIPIPPAGTESLFLKNITSSIDLTQLDPSITKLYIENCPNLTNLDVISGSNVKDLEIHACSGLRSIPVSEKLEELEIRSCENLAEISGEFSESFKKLKIIASSAIASIPSFKEGFESFVLNCVEDYCPLIRNLPQFPQSLREYVVDTDKIEGLTTEFPSNLPNLTTLHFSGFSHLTEINEPFPTNLTELSLFNCTNLESISVTFPDSLTFLNLENCLQLSTFPTQSRLPVLKLFF